MDLVNETLARVGIQQLETVDADSIVALKAYIAMCDRAGFRIPPRARASIDEDIPLGDDSISPEMALYHTLLVHLTTCGVTDFTLEDLIEPITSRMLGQLAKVAEYIQFKESVYKNPAMLDNALAAKTKLNELNAAIAAADATLASSEGSNRTLRLIEISAAKKKLGEAYARLEERQKELADRNKQLKELQDANAAGELELVKKRQFLTNMEGQLDKGETTSDPKDLELELEQARSTASTNHVEEEKYLKAADVLKELGADLVQMGESIRQAVTLEGEAESEKNRYEKLDAQVTASRNELQYCLERARDLTKDVAALEDKRKQLDALAVEQAAESEKAGILLNTRESEFKENRAELQQRVKELKQQADAARARASKLGRSTGARRRDLEEQLERVRHALKQLMGQMVDVSEAAMRKSGLSISEPPPADDLADSPDAVIRLPAAPSDRSCIV